MVHPGPCPDCNGRQFYRVWGLYDEHDAAPGGENTMLAGTEYECVGCGTRQQVRDDPV